MSSANSLASRSPASTTAHARSSRKTATGTAAMIPKLPKTQFVEGIKTKPEKLAAFKRLFGAGIIDANGELAAPYR
jgi:hypothetical protein